jgi:ABC-type nitrate/sulfonate/bicarbonate transport system substrate-binding protein
MRVRTLRGVAVANIALLAASCTPREEQGQETAPLEASVRFPIPIVEAGQTPFYVALDRGYYAQEGLNVRFEMGSRELNPVKTVALGQNDFGVLGGPDALLTARSKGQPLKAVAVLHRNSNFPVLLTLKSSGITKVAQLRGAKVGLFYGHISTDVLRNLFRRQNVNVTEVDVGFDYNQLITRRIKAEWAFRVTAGLDLPAQGVQVNVINPADYGIRSHGYTIFATDKTVAARPELVERFLRATLKGVQYTVANPDSALVSLLKRDSKLDPALNLKRQLLYNEVTSNSAQFPAGFMDAAMFQETYDRLVEEKVIERPFAVRDAYTTAFLDSIHTQSTASAKVPARAAVR